VQRIACLDVFARLRGDAVVVVSPGYAGHELATAQHHDLTIYNMDMGYAAPVCLGLALARPDQRVVAMEGDGSLLMGVGCLTTIARYAPPNLTLLVFDNGQYLTTGRGAVPTATSHGADLALLARGAGFMDEQVCAVDDLADFEATVARALSEAGPWCVVAQVDTSDRGAPRARGDFPLDLVEQAVVFQIRLRQRV
jgi:thiamine pyrophosphate-dependent acetolactate synthase large subunit-like protein